jgi:HEAT repeat protein
VPVLLEKLRAPDSALKQRLRGSARGKIFPNAWLDSANVQHAQARFGFNILGTQAVVALPQLSNLLFHGREPDRKPYATLQDRVGDALSGIGLPALPLLREALTNSDSRVANGAVRGLIGRGILAREAMTDFIALRHSTNTPMVAMLPSNLAFVCEDCDFVPLALEYLKDERPMVQQFALLPLGRAKTNQSLIFPSVVPFLTNTNWTVRHYASNTLMSLDPAMARNHGVNVQ